MSYSLSEAARVTGKNKSTILRAIKSGRISATKHDDGSYSIEPVELDRVFPLVNLDMDATGGAPVATQQFATPRNPQAQPLEVALLEERLRSREERIRDLESQLEDTREQRDRWQDEASYLRKLLPAPAMQPPSQPQPEPSAAPIATPVPVATQQEAPPDRPWWKRIFG